MTGPLRNVEQAAEWLGIPKTTLQAMVSARSVPFTRVGKHVRFSDEHLKAIVAAGEERVVQPPTQLAVAAARRAGRMATPVTPPPTTPPPPPGPVTPPPPSGPKSEAVA